MATLDQRGVDAVTQQRGHLLFDRNDITRCLEFQDLLKVRFRSPTETFKEIRDNVKTMEIHLDTADYNSGLSDNLFAPPASK